MILPPIQRCDQRGGLDNPLRHYADANRNLLNETYPVHYPDRNGENFHKLSLRFSKRPLTICPRKTKSGGFAPRKSILSAAGRYNSQQL